MTKKQSIHEENENESTYPPLSSYNLVKNEIALNS